MGIVLETEHIKISEGIPSTGKPFYIVWLYENGMLYGFERVNDLITALNRAIKYMEVNHGID